MLGVLSMDCFAEGRSGRGFPSLPLSLKYYMQPAQQKLWWKLEKRKRANFSKPERIGLIQECGLLGSLFRSIDTVGKRRREGGGLTTVKPNRGLD